jgi:hypothetical protein
MTGDSEEHAMGLSRRELESTRVDLRQWSQRLLQISDELTLLAATLGQQINDSGGADADGGGRATRQVERRMRLRTSWFAAAAVLGAALIGGAYLLGEHNSGRIAENFARIEAATRADCSFKRDFIILPAEVIRDTGRPAAPFLVRLAKHSRSTFINEGCPQAVDPDTGRPFGQPPEVRTK